MDKLTLAYFSMEFGIDPVIPTYSGGLGILAGDTIRAAADLGLPAVGVTLLHRKGFFRQHLSPSGEQSESDYEWRPEEHLEPLAFRVKATIAGKPVWVAAWRYQVTGESGHTVPLYFLDTNLPENTASDRALTDYLYGGDERYRLCQEAILGYGGIAMLRVLGHHTVEAYHMNEGHSALTILALLEEPTWGRGLGALKSSEREAVTRHCVFTTHTPLPVGHDVFPVDMVREVLGDERADFLVESHCCGSGKLNMTSLALNFSRYVNGVSMRHEEIAQSMHTNYHIDAITNGVHAVTWTSDPFRRLYDRHIPQWRRDNLYLKYAIRIPAEEIWRTHQEAKRELVDEVARRTGTHLAPHVLTIGFARRAAEYKRHDLFFADPERLKRLVREVGPIQIIYGGKAHPRDAAGKAIIRRIFEASRVLKEFLTVVYLEEYDMTLARYLCAGVDLWLNTPQKPQEASGTSGMKAAMNGVPTLSILDGWWIEGHIEGVTGWAIGDGWQAASDTAREVASLYNKLEMVILPLYYQRPEQFAQVMRSVAAQNGSYFNTQRMIRQYLQNAYLAEPGTE